jgi:hypothetical protein
MRFDPEKNLAPTAFDERICHLASRMKSLGLEWQPHAGCFVWDPDKLIKPESPFPGRIYFVLSMARFIEIFGSVEEMARTLVWLPTWHQACLIYRMMSAADTTCERFPSSAGAQNPTEQLIRIYELMIDHLQKRRETAPRLPEHP